MDPGSILGAAASAAAVVEMCTDSLNALLRLQRKFQNADLTARLLLTQLSTLRAALSEVSHWLDNGRHSCLARVFTDLTTSLDACRCLIEHLNQRLGHLGKAKRMNFFDKTRAIWGENERTEFLTLLGHNIAALQLLLTAMQCQSQSEQTVLLQELSSLEIITRARDYSSSLLFLRDDESLQTRRSICTMNSERLDESFVFDDEIFSSGPYLSSMKSNTKYAVRHARSQAEADSSFADFAQGLNSYNEHRRRATRAIRAKERTTEDLQSRNTPSPAVLHGKKLLVIGNSRGSGSTILRALEMAYGDVGLP